MNKILKIKHCFASSIIKTNRIHDQKLYSSKHCEPVLCLSSNLSRYFSIITKSKHLSRNPSLKGKSKLFQEDIDAMAPRNFSDERVIKIRGGTGGPGCFSFERTRIVTTGHPDGGSGGQGGDVYFVGSRDKSQDLSYIQNEVLEGNEGKSGKTKSKNGEKGKDTQLLIPDGTKITMLTIPTIQSEIKDVKTKIICEEIKHGQRILAARGGQAGIGTINEKYKSSFQKGKLGEEVDFRLELSINSDVAMIGFSGSGKSTILAALTRSIGKIGTSKMNTYSPIQGVFRFIDEKKLTLLDLPPIERIEYGDEFIHPNAELQIKNYKNSKHLRKAKILAIVIDGRSDRFKDEVLAILKFIKQYQLADKIVYFLVNKADLLTEEQKSKIEAYFKLLKASFSMVSGLQCQGFEDFVYFIRYKIIGDVGIK